MKKYTTFFPGGSEGKASACNAGDLGSIPGLGRSPGEGNSNPLQYSCLENPMDGGSWRATIPEVAKSQTRLSDFTHSQMQVMKRKRVNKKSSTLLPKEMEAQSCHFFPGGSEGKASACSVGDPGLIPGLGRSPGEGNGNPLQYSCLENPTDRGAW